MTPFELDLGHQPRGMYSVLFDNMTELRATKDFIESFKSSETSAHEYLEKARQAQVAQVNKERPKPTDFEVGNLIMLSTKFVSPPFLGGSGSRKLKAKYVGPFEIVRKIGATSYELDLPASMHAHPVINLEYLRAYQATPERFAEREMPPLVENSEQGELEYEVDHMKDHRMIKKDGLQYLVSWLNYLPVEDSWESADNLAGAQDAIDEHWKKENERNKLLPPARVARKRSVRRA